MHFALQHIYSSYIDSLMIKNECILQVSKINSYNSYVYIIRFIICSDYIVTIATYTSIYDVHTANGHIVQVDDQLYI